MNAKRFSLITILAVIMLAFSTLFGLSIKTDKAGANTVYAQTAVNGDSGASIEDLTKDFKMHEIGARFRLMWTTPNCGLTYVGEMPTELARQVQPKLVFVPHQNIEALKSWALADDSKIDTTTKAKYALGGKYILGGDYVGGLEAAGLITDSNRNDICLNAFCQEEGDVTYLVGGVKSLNALEQANRKWFVIYYFEYMGNRYYAEIPDNNEENVSRSIAYVTSAFAGDQTSAYNNKDDNAINMANFFMDNAISDAINKHNAKQIKLGEQPLTDVGEVINVYVDKEVKATYYDDLLTYSLHLEYTPSVSAQVLNDNGTVNEGGVGGSEVEGGTTIEGGLVNGGGVGGSEVEGGTISGGGAISATCSSPDLSEFLDFKVFWSNPTEKLVTMSRGFINTVGTGEGNINSKVGKWGEKTHNLTVYKFDLSVKDPYVQLEVQDQNYYTGNVPSSFEPGVLLTIKPNGDKRLFLKQFNDVKPIYGNNVIPNEGAYLKSTVTVTGDYDETNVDGQISTFFNVNVNYYLLNVHYKHSSGFTLAEDSYLYLPAGSIYDGESSTTLDGVSKPLTIGKGFGEGKTLKEAINSIIDDNILDVKQTDGSILGTTLAADYWWFAGIADADREVTVTFSNVDKVTPFDKTDDGWDGTAATSFAGGVVYSATDTVNGTKENPYKISTAEQLAYLAKLANEVALNGEFGKGQYFELTNSIDLRKYNSNTKQFEYQDWTPIASAGVNFNQSEGWGWRYFAGTFNGNGFTINGLYHNNTSHYGLGLFGGVSGTVKNLTLRGEITGNGHRIGSVAYIVKAESSALFENINSYVNVTASLDKLQGDGMSLVGGIVGSASDAAAKFINCNNYGTVTAPGHYVGGIVGDQYGIGSLMENCTNYGAVVGGMRVGGIVGSNTQHVVNCVNFGKVSGTGAIQYGVTVKDSSITVQKDADGKDIPQIIQTNGITVELKTGTVTYYLNGAENGWFVGGIIGRAHGVSLLNAVNYGVVSGGNFVGGLVGINIVSSIDGVNKATIANSAEKVKEGVSLSTWIEANYGKEFKITKDGNGYTSNETDRIIAYIDELVGAIGQDFGFTEKNNDVIKDQVYLKIRFIDAQGNALLDYKTKALERGTYVDKDTIVDGVTLQELISNANEQINKDQRTYLPNMFWYSGIVNQDTVIDIVFTEADVWDGTIATAFAGGSGTQADPYLISTGAQLARLAQLVNGKDNADGTNDSVKNKFYNKYFKLTNSIDLNGKAWDPIGRDVRNLVKHNTSGEIQYSTHFAGAFDGNGYTVAGLNVTEQDAQHNGLFGYANTDLEIKNIVVQGQVNGHFYVGGLVGQLNKGTIKNVKSFVNLNCSYQGVGGIVGRVDNRGSVTDCSSYGDVTSTQIDSGGIVGSTYRQAKISNNVNYGNITAQERDAGGIVGNLNGNGIVINNVNYGDVETNSSNYGCGGIIGVIHSGAESNNSVVWAEPNSNGNPIAVVKGGEVIGRIPTPPAIDNKEYKVLTINYYVEGELYSTKYLALEKGYFGRDAEGKFTHSLELEVASDGTNQEPFIYYSSEDTTESPQIDGYLPDKFWVAGYITENMVENVYYSKATVWDGSVANTFAGGNGTKTNPYLIETGAQLALMSKMYSTPKANYGGNVYFKLVNSIDLGKHEWTPIGEFNFDTNTKAVYGFEGEFDGNGKTISGLAVNQSTGTAGLFAGFVGKAYNLTLQGAVTATEFVGGFAGAFGSKDITANLQNTRSFVDVTATKVLDKESDVWAGGFVGYSLYANYSECENYGNIIHKPNNNKALGKLLGGIAGRIDYNTTVENSVNFGHVKGYKNTGGLVGFTGSTESIININNFVNIGSIRSEINNTGGIFGAIQNVNTKKVVITNSHNLGTIIGNQQAGGFIGAVSAGEEDATPVTLDITNCYNAGEITGTQSLGGIIGFLRVGTVSLVEVTNRGLVDGTKNEVGGIIGKIDQLNTKQVPANVTLTSVKSQSIVQGVNDVGGFVGYSKGNLKINRNSGDEQVDVTGAIKGTERVGGFVGYIGTGTTTINGVRNEGATLSGTNDLSVGSAVGGVVGQLGGDGIVNIQNVFNNIAIEGNTSLGGIIGYINSTITAKNSTITNVVNQAPITGKTALGGIIGDAGGSEGATGHTIILSGVRNAAKGIITSTASTDESLVGGLIGRAKINVTINSYNSTSSTNSASVYSDKNLVGGIIGEIGGGKTFNLTGVTNSGEVTGQKCVGGIIGNLTKGTVNLTSVSNNGNVKGANDVGGFVGHSNGDLYIESNNNIQAVTGTIEGTDNVGGFVGYIGAGTTTIKAVRNNGATLKGSNNLGGVVGILKDDGIVDIQNAINSIEINGTDSLGGIIGDIASTNTTTPSKITNVENQASITGKTALGGIIGDAGGPNGATHSIILSGVRNKGAIKTDENKDTNKESIVGGLIGRANLQKVTIGSHNTTISKNSATIESYGMRIGGIIGATYCETEISGCINEGTISAQNSNTNSSVGGYVGYSNKKVTITDSTNSSTINANVRVGGFVGESAGSGETITIQNCTNGGVISGNNWIGGIVGTTASNSGAILNIVSCTNSAKITATNDSAGGILGVSNGANTTITSSTNRGAVTVNNTTSGKAGGIIGYILNKGSVAIDLETKNEGTIKVGSIEAAIDFSVDQKNAGNIVGFANGTSVWDGTFGTSTNTNLDQLFRKDSKDGAYVIQNANDLALLSKLSWNQSNGFGNGSKFKQVSNIDLSAGNWIGICDSNGAVDGWVGTDGINRDTNGNVTYTYYGGFNGDYDGNGKTVKMTETRDGNFGGLFWAIKNGTVKNLVLDGTITAGSYSGALAARINGSATISHIENKVSVTRYSGSTDTNNFIGMIGFVGSNLENVTVNISDCTNKGKMSGNGNHTGGIIGSVYSPSAITLNMTNCINEGEISGNQNAGGLIGNVAENMTLNVTNCKNTKSISANGFVGGIVGKIEANAICNITSTANSGAVTANSTYHAGGFVGYVTGGSTIMITADSTNSGTIKSGSAEAQTNVGTASPWVGKLIGHNDGISVWDGKYPDVKNGYTFSGGGTQNDPYLIQSAQDLAALSALSWSKSGGYGSGVYYKQTVNIDLSAGEWIGICDSNGTISGWVNTDDVTYGFDGVYDGNGKTVKMTETRDNNFGGLFWAIKNGTVKNLVLEGNITAGSYSGALAARISGSAKISDITNRINLSIHENSGDTNSTIGLIGFVAQGVKEVEISNCVNEGNVTGISRGVGGIVGRLLGNTSVTITNCVNKGVISASGKQLVDNDGKTYICAYVGGIVGYIPSTANCTISGCVGNSENGSVKVTASGNAITATSDIGGYASNATGTVDYHAGLIVGLNLGNLTSVWDGKYPTLAANATADTLFNKDSSGNYLIESAQDLATLSALTKGKNYGSTNQWFKLMVNLDLSGGKWQPICYRATNNWYTFASNFDGNSKTIKLGGVSTTQCFGLFAQVSGEIKNLTLTGEITVQENSGALVSCLVTGAKITNITSSVNITGTGTTTNPIGGIIGTTAYGATITISGCTNSGNINASNSSVVGGIIGRAKAVITITNCKNTGNITASASGKAGGVIGELLQTTAGSGSVSNCTNTGKITGGTTGDIYNQ